jgi:DNA-binding transcriptional ArsR family regulator
VSASERDLVAALRTELAAIDPQRACDREAEAAGLGPRLTAREPALARLALRLGGAPQGHFGTHARRRFAIGGDEPFDWANAADHCRAAWLRGIFLARGSLSLAGGRVHLEFVVPAGDAPVLVERLADAEPPPSWRIRRGLGVVTWKRTEAVTAFLGRIGASASLLEIEARGVARALRGDLNRVLNAESANLQRSVAAAGRQLAAIEQLEEDGRLAEQPRVVREVADARRDMPEVSLSEIAERLGLHRSAVQRALDRLERLALHDDEGIGRRYRGGRGGARRSRSGETGPAFVERA